MPPGLTMSYIITVEEINMADKKFDDKDLDKVSGGGFFSDHTDEEYKAAGVELVFANWFGNWR